MNKKRNGVRKLSGASHTWSWRLSFGGKVYTNGGYASADDAYNARCEFLSGLQYAVPVSK